MKISGLFVSKNTAVYMRQLYPPGEADRRIRLFGIAKARTFAGIIAVTVLVFIPVFAVEHAGFNEPVKFVERNGYGGGAKTVTVRAVTQDGYEDKLKIDVDERKYTEDELCELSAKLDKQLWKEILGENTGPENVMYDLTLPDHFEGYPFQVTWKSDKPLILSSSGVINAEKLAEEDPENKGVTVQLRSSLKYGDHLEDRYSYVVVHKNTMTAQEAEGEIISASIKEYDEKSETMSIQELPETAGGRRIVFYPEGMNRGWVVLFLGAAAAVFLIRSKDTKIKEEADNRRKQMEEDHPVILNQYMLYFLAGMNPRSIWNCICGKYEEGLKEGKGSRRYVYEEMVMTRNRMDEGLSELAAYDEFAIRCDNVRYRAFISFVKQAVVKGNDGLGEILYEEVDKAQREKNNRIKTQASEAETKLLLPMFMMLIVVLAIVMIPAFIGLKE